MIAKMKIERDHNKRDAGLEEALREFRASALADVERPDAFWASQRNAVFDRIAERRRSVAWKPVIVCGATLAIIATVAGLWFGRARALPVPDFAAGYDQDLLLDVQRLTEAETSLALEPAQLLAGEIAGSTQKNQVP